MIYSVSPFSATKKVPSASEKVKVSVCLFDFSASFSASYGFVLSAASPAESSPVSPNESAFLQVRAVRPALRGLSNSALYIIGFIFAGIRIGKVVCAPVHDDARKIFRPPNRIAVFSVRYAFSAGRIKAPLLPGARIHRAHRFFEECTSFRILCRPCFRRLRFPYRNRKIENC